MSSLDSGLTAENVCLCGAGFMVGFAFPKVLASLIMLQYPALALREYTPT